MHFPLCLVLCFVVLAQIADAFICGGLCSGFGAVLHHRSKDRSRRSAEVQSERSQCRRKCIGIEDRAIAGLEDINALLKTDDICKNWQSTIGCITSQCHVRSEELWKLQWAVVHGLCHAKIIEGAKKHQKCISTYKVKVFQSCEAKCNVSGVSHLNDTPLNSKCRTHRCVIKCAVKEYAEDCKSFDKSVGKFLKEYWIAMVKATGIKEPGANDECTRLHSPSHIFN